MYQAEIDYGVSFEDDETLNTNTGPYNHWVFPLHVTSGMNSPLLELVALQIPPACNVTGKYNFANWTRLDTKLPGPPPPPPPPPPNVTKCTPRPPPPPPMPPVYCGPSCFTLNDLSGVWASSNSITISAAGNGVITMTPPAANQDFTASATTACNVFQFSFPSNAAALQTQLGTLSSDKTLLWLVVAGTGADQATWTRTSAASPSPAPVPTQGLPGGACPPPPPPPNVTNVTYCGDEPVVNVTVNCNCTPPPPPPPPRDNNTITPAVAIDTRAPTVTGIYTGKPAGNYTAGDVIVLVLQMSRPVAFTELPSSYSQAPPPRQTAPARSEYK